MKIDLYSDNSKYLEEFDEHFDLFVKGKLNPDEEVQFKRIIQSDPELKDRARTLSYLVKNINIVGDERDRKVLSGFQQLSGEDELMTILNDLRKKEREVILRTIIKWSSSIAVIFIIGLIIGIPYLKSYQAATLADRYYTEYDISYKLRGGEDTSVEYELASLVENMKRQSDLKTTINSLEKIYKKSISDDFNEYTNHSNTIAWYLALSYLKNNQKDKSIQILDKLINDNPESAVAGMAGELKKDILDLW